MKTTFVVCDLCKLPISKWDKSVEYKMKKKYNIFDSSGWDTLDVHQSCADKFYQLCHDDVPDKRFVPEHSNIVRCFECVYYSDEGFCACHNSTFAATFYCKYGVREND